MAVKLSEEEQRTLLGTAQKRLKRAMDDDYENRQLALDDLKFIAEDGAQWPDAIKAERLGLGRPCITVNKMPVFIDQVVGDQRMNRPSAKIIPVDSKADPKVARILGGWVKHVQQISRGDVAIDHGFEHAAACGYGAMRVVTKFTNDSSFEQDAYIEKVDNALAVYWGPHTEYDCSDAMYCFLISDMDREEFKMKYGEEPVPFNTADARFVEGWCTKDTVRLAEYFAKEVVIKKIYLLEDGTVVDKLEKGQTFVRMREVEAFKIMWYLLSADKVIDSKEWVGKKYIPVIPIWGRELNVGGKRIIRGLIRNAKDSQRMYNYWNSCDTETIALQPRNPYIMTPKQLGEHKEMWDNAQRINYPYLLVDVDKEAPGWPQRQAPPQMSSAMVEKLRETDQEMRDTIGLQKASLGMQSNERSGEAIRERKREGDVGTYAFIDNLSRSIEHLGRILIDIAPGLLDTQRIIRLGLDSGDFEFAEVNVPTEDGNILNDLAVGTYDVVVTVGPSFTTQRTEAQRSMQEFIQYYPVAAQVIGDLYAKSMDWPGADEVAQRLEFLLPPELKAQVQAKRAEKAGEPATPPVVSPAPPPDPMVELKVKEEALKLKEAEVKLAQEQVKLEGLQLENEMKRLSSKEEVRKLIEQIHQEDMDASQKGQNLTSSPESNETEDLTNASKEQSTTTSYGNGGAQSGESLGQEQGSLGYE